MMANDPHLLLQAPPIWYEQVLSASDYRVRGVTFPGVPFVVIGETDTGAWGFTNAGVDVIDFYEYETRNDQSEYRYGDEWREFETQRKAIPVADGADREVTVRKTVHGPVVGRESDGDELRSAIGIAWTGFTATRTTVAIHEMARSAGLDEFETALRDFDEPTQNCVYTARDGDVLYRVTGRVPIRRTDGAPVRGDQVFDGSAREGEWDGYTPFDDSSWDGFIPFDEMPHSRNPDYVGTANQRIVDDDAYPHYLAESYAAPFRGIRLWDRLDELVDSGEVSASDMAEVQRDDYDLRADLFVPVLQAERQRLEEPLRQTIDRLTNWDRQMARDSRAALVFIRFLDHYRDTVVRPVLDEGLDDRRDVAEYMPNDWVLAQLAPDSRWFPESRTDAVRGALERALEEIEAADWEVYGDYNRTTITHPFDQPWLNYPEFPTDGSGETLFNVRPDADAGSSWRQICPMDGASRCITPGGNDGSPFSPHFHDQLKRWADGRYKSMDREIRGDVAVRIVEDHS